MKRSQVQEGPRGHLQAVLVPGVILRVARLGLTAFTDNLRLASVLDLGGKKIHEADGS